mgnify:CR=1 FL=1|tara:strand:+ start:570 stop:704 length:135 start_codon:yes stop_codon:yes gene_type:complete
MGLLYTAIKQFNPGLYQNVLGRSADDDGLAFYTNHFTAGTMTRV